MQKGQLTAAEQQVAEQVAKGRRNEEIAAALGLSPRTVEWHLSKVYRKLRVRSRTELVVRVAAAGGRAERRLDTERGTGRRRR
jgi:LuxR family maltose regulon positive regulatory protein